MQQRQLWRASRPLGLLAIAATLAACGGGGGNNGFYFAGTAPPAPGNPAPPSTGAPAFKAEIRRTAMGVPHIKAADWGGVGYGYGYAQAQDNLCTMADAFLTYRGERSKNFGADALLVYPGTIGRPKNIESDFFHKHVLSSETIDAFAQAQPDKLKQLVEGFAAGYSRYVRDLKGGGEAGAHAACRGEAWVAPIASGDIWRRLYAANLTAGYGNFVAQIASAVAPASTAGQAQASARALRRAQGTQLAALRTQPPKAPALEVGGKHGVGSNMYAFGTAGTGDDSALQFGNPHWYWRGPDRFYQAQLTIPGELDVSGASFLGVPLILIGFNQNVAWSHTVSAARRFGLYELALAEGDPTSYLRDGKAVKMKPSTIAVDVKGGPAQTRTLYKSEYGPLINLAGMSPALAWSPRTAFAIRDINADNFRAFRTWLRWDQAKSLDEFIAIQREEAGIPWVNTTAVGRGSAKAWYADITAVPNVSPQQTERCTTAVGQLLAAALERVPVFDGSRSECDWQTDPDSVQKGAVGPSRMPSLLRDDYVANMNASAWLTNPNERLTGYPAIFGGVETGFTTRSRLGHLMAQARLSGTDGYAGRTATAATVRQMVLDSRVYTAERFKAQVLALVCAVPRIDVAAANDPYLGDTPAGTVQTAEACAALRAWDDTDNIDARGAHVWDEFWGRVENAIPKNDLYAVPFSSEDPLNTPREIRSSASDALRQAFGAALMRVEASPYPVNAPRGDYLFVTRNGRKIPLFGGMSDLTGVFTTTATFNRLDRGGYSLDGDSVIANSYMQIVRFPAGKVEADTFLTYSLSDDPASAHHADYTRAYSAKQWLRVPYTEAEIAADPAYRSVALSE